MRPIHRVSSVAFSTPAGVRGVEWRRNHNWLKVSYLNGMIDHLDAVAVLRGECSQCSELNTINRKKTNRWPKKIFCSFCGCSLELKEPEPQLAYLGPAAFTAKHEPR